MARLAGIVSHMARTTVVTSAPDSFYAQCRTRLPGFTDELEFYLDAPAGVIQVPLPSRLGKGNLGVNRKRVEALRRQFEQGGA